MQGLEKQLNTLDMEIAKLKTQAEGKEREIKEEETRIKELEKAQKDVRRFASLCLSPSLGAPQGPDVALVLLQLTAQRKTREASAAKSAESFAAREAAFKAATTSLSQSEDLLQTIEYGAGLSKNAKSSGYEGQLAAAKELAGSLETEGQLAKHRIDSLQKELKDKEPKAKKAAAESKGLVANVERARKDKEGLEAQLRASGYDEAEEARLDGEREQEMQAVEGLRQVRPALIPSLAVARSRGPSLTLLLLAHSAARPSAARSSAPTSTPTTRTRASTARPSTARSRA